jgi:hypothetical protein
MPVDREHRDALAKALARYLQVESNATKFGSTMDTIQAARKGSPVQDD